MKLKRILSLAIVVLMIVALVGCGPAKREIIELTLSTEDAEAILAAAGIMLPDPSEAAGANSTIKWLAHYDSFHNYRNDEVVNTGFFTFKERYGCDVEWIETTWGERFNDLANLVIGGTPPDFMPGETSFFPEKVLQGLIQSVDPYIDYSDPIWSGMEPYAKTYFSLGDNTYMIITDMSFGTIVPYNRRVIDEWGFDDPAELFANDEWTWDVFYEMCFEFTDADEDRYALDGWYFARSIMQSTGVPIVGFDTETGRFYSNADDPRLERAADVLYDISRNDLVYPWYNYGWSLRNGTDGGGMKEGLCLFQPIGTWSITGPVETVSAVWGDIAGGEVMFVPVPRDPNGDGKYYLTSSPSAYVIIKDCKNPEGVALFASCERFKILDPTVVSIDRYQLEHTYMWSQEMLDMYDTCYDIANTGLGNLIVTYGEDNTAGYGTQVGDMLRYFNDDIGHPASAGGASTWAQTKEAYSDAFSAAIDALNQRLDDFEANGFVADAQ